MTDSSHPFNGPEFTLQKKRSKKPIIIGVIVIIALVIAGVIAYALRDQLFGSSRVDAPKTSQDQRGDVDEAALSKTTSAASTYLASGNIEAASKVMDDAIKNTSSPTQKSALYLNKASILAASDTPSALKAGEESVALNPNFENTAYLAELYERNGDKQKAIEFYQKAINLYNQMDHAETDGPTNGSLYQDRIDRLRGQ